MIAHSALTRGRVALLLAVLLVLALWLVSQPSEPRAEAAGPASRGLEQEPAQPRELVEVSDDGRSALAELPAPEEPVVAKQSEPELEQPASEPDEYLLRGRAVVIDPDGIAHVAEDGKLELGASWGTYGRRLYTDVEDGLWACMVPEGTQVSVSELELGGRPVFFAGGRDEVVTVPENRFLEIEGRWTASPTLIVRDANTGFELDQLEIMKMSRLYMDDDQHPGRSRSRKGATAATTSPIDLAPIFGKGRESVPLFVRRPGYAWGRVDVDPSNSGERFLELVPGGDISIELTGAEPPRKAWLQLKSEGERSPFVEFQVGIRDVFSLQSLPEGTYTVEVTLGQWFQDPVVLGSAMAEVVAGRETSIAVPLEGAPELQLAPLGGTLFFPEGWDLDMLILSARLQGPPVGDAPGRHALYERNMEKDPDRPGLFRWHLPEVQVGTWEITLHEPPMGVRVELGPEGRTDVAIEIPPPILVSVRVLDADTGERAKLDRITWHPPRPEGAMGGSVSFAVPNPATGDFDFIAPVGEIWISVWGDDYERSFPGNRFEIIEGTNVLTIEVRRAIALLIVLKDGDTTVPWVSDWDLKHEQVDGPNRGRGSCDNPVGFPLTVRVPGTYRLDLPRVPGFLPVDPIEVVIERGPRKTITVPLVRVH